MNKSLLFLNSICAFCLLSACGGGAGGAGAPPPAIATHFSVSAPASATPGASFSFTVTALDSANNAVSAYSGTVHFTSSDGQAVLPANATLTNGMGNFSATLATAGAQTITAADTVTPSITGTSSAISVSASAATHVSVSAPSSATPGISFGITVTVLDGSNNVATGYSGTVHFTSSDGQAVLPANSTLTNGMGNFSATLATAGAQTITATDTVTASITGTSNSINVGTNLATHFSFTTPASASKGTSFNFQVMALDAANNVAISYSGTAHFTSTDPQAVLPANSTLTQGAGSFSATLNSAGTQTITATDTVTASITGTSNAIPVFSGCTGQGQQCPPQRPPCCPGLVCTPASTRAFCEPLGNASPFGKNDDRFPLLNTTEASRFTVTCALETARESHTATLLANGLVLITGGDDHKVSLASAELFNAETHSFARAGDMAYARTRHTATLLASGAVLLIGGRDAGGNALATTELFDPNRISFALAASVNTARASHTATLLGNGKVLIIGGDNGTVALATAELFDPASASFVTTGSMGSPRDFHTATLLQNGKVLVTGGRDADGNVLATAELFDPTTGRFTQTGSMSRPRESHTATLLNDGKILIAGGDNGGVSLDTAEIFDPTNGTFAPTGSMETARYLHTATLLTDGTVLVAGGAHFTAVVDSSSRPALMPASSATAELFNPASGSFTPAGHMVNARARHTATLLADGNIVLVGGVDDEIRAERFPVSEMVTTAEVFQ